MKKEFSRIDRLPPYIFGEINKLKAKLRKEGKDIIDFGMGNPDMPTPKHIRDKLKEVSDKPGTGRYSMSRGIPGLRKAQAKYYEKRFGVKLNPENEVVVTLGSKEGLANLAQAISSPGDIIVSIQEKAVRTNSEYISWVLNYKPGKVVSLEVLRNDNIKNIYISIIMYKELILLINCIKNFELWYILC